MTVKEIEAWKAKIDKMNAWDCGWLLRFGDSPASRAIFQTKELWGYFGEHFTKLGGMTPKLSKELGWKQ